MSAIETKTGARYLEVTVTRTQSSVVYLAVPEDHPGLVDGNAGLSARAALVNACLVSAVEATLQEPDWETPLPGEAHYEWDAAREVPEAEARRFRVYQTPAAKRAAAEAAGQRVLL